MLVIFVKREMCGNAAGFLVCCLDTFSCGKMPEFLWNLFVDLREKYSLGYILVMSMYAQVRSLLKVVRLMVHTWFRSAWQNKVVRIIVAMLLPLPARKASSWLVGVPEKYVRQTGR